MACTMLSRLNVGRMGIFIILIKLNALRYLITFDSKIR
ncbi:hypothetical protein VT84_20035 [Gemmata sp. SH-PL17]|nr:hypothetical protein VT84_20035 [Gemmata sp. SH-PL17]